MSSILVEKIKSDDVSSHIGKTPLLRLRIACDVSSGVEVYAKAEHLNPSGSVKDRAALAMILDGERRGVLTKDKIIIDATSGNTGIAYAMIGAARGYRVTLCVPQNISPERRLMLRVYGADLIETDPLQATDGAHEKAKELVAAEPQKYFFPNQYDNDANWRAHYQTTAPEIWEQTNERVTHFVAGIGTAGTLVGTARRLKELNRNLRAIAMQPDSPLHGLEGMRHLASTVVPKIYDAKIVDSTIEISTEDAQAMARRLAREEGLFVGVSSGANVLAAIELARELPHGSVVVTILCDDGSRYTSEEFWKEK
ncbi:MAG: cysteine synthase family protein [Pyrinomonadaceae bacterium]